MRGFDIDETQAEFVAELKLRNINEEYILNRTKDIAKLEGEIAELEEILSSEENIKKVISDELAAVNKKYVMPRRTGRIEPHEVIEVSLEPEVEEYPVTIMLSRDGYLKKMTDRVLKKATTLKYKDGDKPFIEFPSSNTHELLVFTNKSQVYKCKVAAFEDTKSAQLGSYLPTDLEMEPDESVIWVIDPEDYKADVLFVFGGDGGQLRRHRGLYPPRYVLRRQQAAVCPGAQGGPRHRAGLERLSFDELQHVAAQDQDDHQHAGRPGLYGQEGPLGHHRRHNRGDSWRRRLGREVHRAEPAFCRCPHEGKRHAESV